MGNGNKAEMLIAVCAVISSIAAVYIAWDQARVMRSQEKAEVWPMIQLTHQTDVDKDTSSYTFHIQNAGVGPALIDTYAVRIPGTEQTQDLHQMVRYLMPESIGEPAWANTNINGRVLRQGDELLAVRGMWDSSDETTAAIQSRIQEYVSGGREPAEVFVCYCSILEDCWVSTTMASNPRPYPVKSCDDIDRAVQQLAPVKRTLTPEKVPAQ